MLSYQHAYHAGNEADVMKHTLLALVLRRLAEKPAPLLYIETHAGRGLYPIDAPEMQKRGEYRAGALRLWQRQSPAALAPALQPYAEVLDALNPGADLRLVPGSPAIARRMLRPQDEMHLFEMHKGEAELLREAAETWPHCHIHLRDGLTGAVPFIRAGRRTLVLIDPAYERSEEYMSAPRAIASMLARRPQLTLLLWYPLLRDAPHHPMIALLKALGTPATWQGELAWHTRAADGRGLMGSGLVVCNLPYRLDETLGAALQAMTEVLDLEGWSSRFLVAPQ